MPAGPSVASTIILPCGQDAAARWCCSKATVACSIGVIYRGNRCYHNQDIGFMLAVVVGISLSFLLQPPLRACASQCAPHLSARAVVCSELPADTAALISELREAEAALQALERENDKSARALDTKSKLEQSVLTGVAALRESGMPDDQIMISIMGPNVGQPPPAAPPAAEDPISDRPLSNGVTNGMILIRDKDGSIKPFVLIHRLRITASSAGEGTAECVCMLNAPESHKPSGFSIEISVKSIREVTPAIFVHVEESAVLGMLHDATDGAYGTAATTPAAINLPSYFK